jgi:hypothetical protein
MQIRKIKTSVTRPDETLVVRYLGFMNELELLGNRYGVALRVVGGIQCFDPAVERVAYETDFINGNLEPRIGLK